MLQKKKLACRKELNTQEGFILTQAAVWPLISAISKHIEAKERSTICRISQITSDTARHGWTYGCSGSVIGQGWNKVGRF